MKVVVEAYNNPTVAAKYQEEIGALMKKQAEKDMQRLKKVIEKGGYASEHHSFRVANKQREVHARAILRYLYRHGPLTRDSIFKGVRAAGLSISRDIMVHTLLTYRGLGLVKETRRSGINYWYIEGDLEAFLNREKNKDEVK